MGNLVFRMVSLNLSKEYLYMGDIRNASLTEHLDIMNTVLRRRVHVNYGPVFWPTLLQDAVSHEDRTVVTYRRHATGCWTW